MTYRLGVDVGTTYTAAALQRSDGLLEVVPLGSRSATVPSVLFVGGDGEILFGEAAEDAARTAPGRVIRHVKRRVGDDMPLVVGESEHAAHDLLARMIAWAVERAAALQGCPATAVAVTHPAGWGAHKLELLCSALRDHGLGEAALITEPAAAAISYAGSNRVRPGTALAVYDLGGGTCDAAVLRAGVNGGFELVGRPLGLSDVGGIDFDDALLAHVLSGFADEVSRLDLADAATASAIALLRRECVVAKEALTADTSATVPVVLGELATKVRITRSEFEAMIEPSIEGTVAMFAEAIEDAELEPGELRGVLLTGGSSRIPLVTQLISQDLRLRVDMDADPKMAVAIGAAISQAGVLPDSLAAAADEADRAPLAGAAVLAGAAAGGAAAARTTPDRGETAASAPPLVPAARSDSPTVEGVPLVPAARSGEPTTEEPPLVPAARWDDPTVEGLPLVSEVRPGEDPVAAPPGPGPVHSLVGPGHVLDLHGAEKRSRRSRFGARRAITLVGLATTALLAGGAGLAALYDYEEDQLFVNPGSRAAGADLGTAFDPRPSGERIERRSESDPVRARASRPRTHRCAGAHTGPDVSSER